VAQIFKVSFNLSEYWVMRQLNRLLRRVKNRDQMQEPMYCFGIDEDYAWPLLVSLYSAKKNYKKFKEAFILYDPKCLSDKMIFYINQQSKLIGVELKFTPLHLTSHSRVEHHITPTSYLRFQIPQVSRKKVFWFDSDLLFLKGWHQISEYARSGQSDIEPIFARLHWGKIESESNQAVLTSKGKYFNTGVLLINSKLWHQAQIMQNLFSIMPKYIDYGFEWADQCVLNYYFRGEYGQIDPRYNSIPEEYSNNHTRILHFAGSNKPWKIKVDENCKLVEIENQLEIQDLLLEEKNAWQKYRDIEQELLALFTLNHRVGGSIPS
jgi:lipopolysaccharide biosynthesis glycosyltransferase